MVFESLGGVSAEAERTRKCLNKAVVVNTETSVEVVATRFWQRIGINILRGNCRSFYRRIGGHSFDGEINRDPVGGSRWLDIAGGP